MKVEVKLFAVARQVAGSEMVTLELGEAPTVADVRTALVQRFPALGATMRHMMMAVDTEYAGDDTPLGRGSEVALIPPVSGG